MRPLLRLLLRLPGVLFAIAIFSGSPEALSNTDARDGALLDDWRIQRAAQSGVDGERISSLGFDASGWHSTSVPATVLGALVNDGVYRNIFYGTNLAAIPSAPFTNAWWFRKEFLVPENDAAGNADLIFEGINYRANIWLNGQQIAGTNQTFGAYRIFHSMLAKN